MKYQDVLTPEQLLLHMDKNIHYGFVNKNIQYIQNKEVHDWYTECIVQDGESLI